MLSDVGAPFFYETLVLLREYADRTDPFDRVVWFFDDVLSNLLSCTHAHVSGPRGHVQAAGTGKLENSCLNSF